MIYNILTMSRQQMSDIMKTANSMENQAIISICSSEPEILMTKNGVEKLSSIGCQGVLPLVFSDLKEENKKRLSDKYIFFDEDMARQIISFLDVLRDKEKKILLLIHCDAGVSRSGAVGIFACRYLGMNEEKFLKDNIIHPNSYVYDTLVKVSGLQGDYKKFWENFSDTIIINPHIRFS